MRGAIPPHALMVRCLEPGQLHIRLSNAVLNVRYTILKRTIGTFNVNLNLFKRMHLDTTRRLLAVSFTEISIP
jgi:hypothetical protein